MTAETRRRLILARFGQQPEHTPFDVARFRTALFFGLMLLVVVLVVMR